jgi:threonine/homoserine/homoserine lactone efflux protein
MTLHKTSLETNAASHTSSATNMTVIAVAVTTVLILVAVAIAVAIALARKRGMFQHPASRNEMPERVCGMVIVE